MVFDDKDIGGSYREEKKPEGLANTNHFLETSKPKSPCRGSLILGRRSSLQITWRKSGLDPGSEQFLRILKLYREHVSARRR
jgi:hypothetical protein